MEKAGAWGGYARGDSALKGGCGGRNQFDAYMPERIAARGSTLPLPFDVFTARQRRLHRPPFERNPFTKDPRFEWDRMRNPGAWSVRSQLVTRLGHGSRG